MRSPVAFIRWGFRVVEEMNVDRFEADLHIHTLLSPCAELEMIPSLIVEMAIKAKLDMIAITDHNSCENAASVMSAAQGTGLRVLPGIEVQSVEGVHLLCIFDDIEQAVTLQEEIYANLPNIPGASRYFDQQIIVDSADEFIEYCQMPLAVPCYLTIDAIYKRVNKHEGITIPSHIDRSGTGIMDVLGMMPGYPPFLGVEISKNIEPAAARLRFPSICKLPIFCNSDAHWLSAIGNKRTVLYLKHRSVDELILACEGRENRRVANA